MNTLKKDYGEKFVKNDSLRLLYSYGRYYALYQCRNERLVTFTRHNTLEERYKNLLFYSQLALNILNGIDGLRTYKFL